MGKKVRGGDITVPVSRKIKKHQCLGSLSNNSHKTCEDSNVTVLALIRVDFQLSRFTNSYSQTL